MDLILEEIEESADELDLVNDGLTELAEKSFSDWSDVGDIIKEAEGIIATMRMELDAEDVAEVVGGEGPSVDEVLEVTLPIYCDDCEDVYELRFTFFKEGEEFFFDAEVLYDWEEFIDHDEFDD